VVVVERSFGVGDSADVAHGTSSYNALTIISQVGAWSEMRMAGKELLALLNCRMNCKSRPHPSPLPKEKEHEF